MPVIGSGAAGGVGRMEEAPLLEIQDFWAFKLEKAVDHDSCTTPACLIAKQLPKLFKIQKTLS